MHSLTQAADLQQLTNSADVVVLNVYRGDWCPFCRKYLKAFDAAFVEFEQDSVKLFGLSVDDEAANAKLKQKLGLNFDLVADPKGISKDKFNNPISTGHPQAKKTANGFFLQPAIYIFKQGELVFSWQQKSKLLNLAGALNRIEVEEIVEQVKQVSQVVA